MNWKEAKRQLLSGSLKIRLYYYIEKMKFWKHISWRPYKPYLAAHLDLGFVGFQTHIMKRAYERYAYDYIRLEWHFFKWRGGFNLYKPGEKI